MSGSPGAPRIYRSELRQRQAAETRKRVIESAVDLFGRQGYQATTYAQIAAAAGVSVETVQKHGPKSALLWAALEFASVGVEGETDFFVTDLGNAMLQVRDPDELAVQIGETMLAINARSAGVWMAMTGAAQGDEEFRGVQADVLREVRRQLAHVLRWIADRGWLRDDVPFDEIVEALCIITCIETYVRFVLQDDKTDTAYKAFVARTARETILAR